MFKYAFFANSARLSPDKYSLTYENDEFYCYVSAVHGMKMARELAAKLSEQGIEYLDLCGDFDAEKAEDIKNASGGKLDVCYAKYTKENQEQFDALEAMNEYGLIIMGKGMGDAPERLELRDEEYNTHIAIVASDQMAIEVAKDMVEKGIHFIELCGYFNLEKAEMISEAIGRKVPVGYCG